MKVSRHIVAECANTLKKSKAKKANMEWRWRQRVISDEEDKTDDNYVTSLTTNLQPIANIDLLSSAGQQLLNADSTGICNTCAERKSLIDNLEAEQKGNVTLLAMIEYIEEKRFIVATERKFTQIYKWKEKTNVGTSNRTRRCERKFYKANYCLGTSLQNTKLEKPKWESRSGYKCKGNEKITTQLTFIKATIGSERLQS